MATSIFPTASRSARTIPPSRSRAAAGTGAHCATLEDVFVAGAETTGGARMAFGGDGMLYVSAGGGGDSHPQDPAQSRRQSVASHARGPRAARQSVRRPRRLQARDFHARPPQHARPRGASGDGQIWQVEMGPNGGDEVNVLTPGGNYGWPLVSFGRTYPGPAPVAAFQQDGFIDPVVFWVPSISTSGLAFYTGEALPKWRGDIFVGGMRYGEIPNTGRLERILINENMEELRREPLLVELRQRIRDVRQGPDGLLYLLTDYAEDAALLRIAPLAVIAACTFSPCPYLPDARVRRRRRRRHRRRLQRVMNSRIGYDATISTIRPATFSSRFS